MIAAFFRGVNMKGGGKKSWNGKTLGELRSEYKSPEEFEKQYDPVEKSENIAGLGNIKFRLNPASYFNLNEVIQDAEAKLNKNKGIFDATSNIVLQKQKHLDDGKQHIKGLDNENPDKILNDNIDEFKSLIGNVNDTRKEEATFLTELVGKTPPTICFGATDEKEAEGYYKDGCVYIDVDKKIRSIRFENYDEKTNDERFIGTLVHESIHHYDAGHKEISNFLDKTEVFNIYDPTTMRTLCNKMDSIATIMESIECKRMKSYANNAKTEIERSYKHFRLGSYTHVDQELRNGFKYFIGEIMPNIYSTTAHKNEQDYQDKFLTNLRAAAKKNSQAFTGEDGMAKCNFLHDFFTGYRETVQKSGLTLPNSLTNAMSNVISAYITVSKEALQKLDKSQQALDALKLETQQLKQKIMRGSSMTPWTLNALAEDQKQVTNRIINEMRNESVRLKEQMEILKEDCRMSNINFDVLKERQKQNNSIPENFKGAGDYDILSWIQKNDLERIKTEQHQVENKLNQLKCERHVLCTKQTSLDNMEGLDNQHRCINMLKQVDNHEKQINALELNERSQQRQQLKDKLDMLEERVMNTKMQEEPTPSQKMEELKQSSLSEKFLSGLNQPVVSHVLQLQEQRNGQHENKHKGPGGRGF